MLRLAGLLIVLWASAVSAGYYYNNAGSDSGPSFITEPVRRATILNVVRATGTVEAVSSVDVSSELSGRVADVFVTFNDTVLAGQPIAQLDREGFLAQVNEARATLKVAEATADVQQASLERAKVAVANAKTARMLAEAQSAAARSRQDEFERELQRKLVLARSGDAPDREVSQLRTNRDAGASDLRAALDQVQMKVEAIAMSEAEVRMAEASLRNAESVVEEKGAALDQANVDLGRTVLRAPIDGIIIKRDINPGQTVAVSLEARTLFVIAHDLKVMQVRGIIDEADIGLVRVGQETIFTVDAYPDRSFEGRVLQVRKAPEVSQNVVTYAAIISAPNPDLLLFPGMTAALRIVAKDTGEILTVPNRALRFRPAGSLTTAADAPASRIPVGQSAKVWKVGPSGRPELIEIGIGASDDEKTQLTDGPLTEGQQLIVGVAKDDGRRRFFDTALRILR
jgi:HlyD family secretion protein